MTRTAAVLLAISSIALASPPARAQAPRTAGVSRRDADGSTPLHRAAERNDLAAVEALLKSGADPKAETRYHITPLYFAALNGNAAMIERLLDAGADANAVSHEGQPMLMTAALNGNPDAVRLLLVRGAKVDATEPFKRQTALMWAAAEGNAAAIRVLVEAGANVNTKSAGGLTPFLFAVRNAHIDAAVALLEHGANVDDVAPDGTSALGMAVVNAYFELASVLLDLGADPNMADPRGSALHTIAWLRKPGADGAAGVGNTPHGPPPPTGNVSALQLAQKLLEKGANPNVRIEWTEPMFGKEGGTARNPPNIQLGRHFLSYIGATPFYVAAKNGDVQLMKLLAAHGADATLTTKAGITPLMVASGLDYWEGEAPGPFTGVSEAERLDAVKLALDLGNDINAQAHFGDYPMEGDKAYTLLYYPHNIDGLLLLGVGDPRWNGSTALIGAVISNQPSIVKFLLEHGARPDEKTALGWTALDVANGVFFANAKKEYPAAAALLRQAAARPATGAGVVDVDASKIAELAGKGGPLGSGEGFTASIARRTGPGQVEVHRKETDIFYILDGEATFVTGGTMIGGKETRPDQLLGTNIDGGETHHLKKGDWIAIPAGTPHWFKEVPQPISYYMVKVIKP